MALDPTHPVCSACSRVAMGDRKVPPGWNVILVGCNHGTHRLVLCPDHATYKLGHDDGPDDEEEDDEPDDDDVDVARN